MKIEMKSLKLLHLVDECIKMHKQIFEDKKMRWDKGDVTGIWRDPCGSATKMASGSTTGKRTGTLSCVKNEHSRTAATVECSGKSSTIF